MCPKMLEFLTLLGVVCGEDCMASRRMWLRCRNMTSSIEEPLESAGDEKFLVGVETCECVKDAI